MFESGSRIGRYVVLDLLGRGGMGAVHRAWDETLDRVVALKVLLGAQVDLSDAERRLLREARLAARVNHPSVAHIYDVGEHEGMPFIAMEYVPGRQLRAEMGEPMRVDRAVLLARQALDGLAEAHHHEVIHRDLKPENILISGRDQVKILDFGLAKPLAGGGLVESVDQSVGLTGTPRYMAPEQFLGKAIDARTDLYALGAVMFEMLAGRPAHSGGSLLELARSVLDGPTPKLDAQNVPRALAAAVERAISRDPAQRFESAEAMKAAIAEIEGRAAMSLENAPRPEVLESYEAHPRARTLAMRARDALVGFGTSTATLAAEMAEKAIEIDPGFALAHAIHAEACATVFFQGHSDPGWLDKAEGSLEHAEKIAPALPDLRVARARMLWNKTFNFPAETALRELLRALKVDPTHVGALRLFASITGHIGLTAPMEIAIERRLRADPNDQIMQLFQAGLLLLRNEPTRAVELLEPHTKLDPRFEDVVFWWMLGHAKVFLGDIKAAAEITARALEKRPTEPTLLALAAMIHARQGRADQARAMGAAAAKIIQSETHPHHAFHFLACAESLLKNPAGAVEWLARTSDEGFPCWSWFSTDPLLEGMRASPEGAAFLRELRRRHAYFEREFDTSF